jgi:hypothetical protein
LRRLDRALAEEGIGWTTVLDVRRRHLVDMSRAASVYVPTLVDEHPEYGGYHQRMTAAILP